MAHVDLILILFETFYFIEGPLNISIAVTMTKNLLTLAAQLQSMEESMISIMFDVATKMATVSDIQFFLLIENQGKCVGQNCETWKCETIGEGNRSNIQAGSFDGIEDEYAMGRVEPLIPHSLFQPNLHHYFHPTRTQTRTRTLYLHSLP